MKDISAPINLNLQGNFAYVLDRNVTAPTVSKLVRVYRVAR